MGSLGLRKRPTGEHSRYGSSCQREREWPVKTRGIRRGIEGDEKCRRDCGKWRKILVVPLAPDGRCASSKGCGITPQWSRARASKALSGRAVEPARSRMVQSRGGVGWDRDEPAWYRPDRLAAPARRRPLIRSSSVCEHPGVLDAVTGTDEVAASSLARRGVRPPWIRSNVIAPIPTRAHCLENNTLIRPRPCQRRSRTERPDSRADG